MTSVNNDFPVALGWDDEIVEESSFTLLEPGEYDFEVIDFTQGQYNGGQKIPPCPEAGLTLRIEGENGSSTQVFERLFLVSNMEWKISEFFISIGQKEQGKPLKPKWSEVLGAKGRAEIEVNEYVNKDGEERQNNRVKKYLPPKASFTPGEF